MKLLKQAVIGSLSFSVVLLAACGGSGGSSSTASTEVLVSASKVLGQSDFVSSSVNGPTATAAKNTLASPQGSVATNGTLMYVADTGNSRILGFNTIPAAATNASADFIIGQGSPAGSTPSVAGLSRPQKVSISDNGQGSTLVVADTGNNRVLIWKAALPAANDPTPSTSGNAVIISGGTATNYKRLKGPTAATIVNSPVPGKRLLIVVDQDNNRVLVFNDVAALMANPTTTNADTVLGQPDFDATVAANTAPNQGATGLTQTNGLKSLNNPTDVWSDGFTLLVTDTFNSRVLYWDHVPDGSLGVNEPAKAVLGQSSVFGVTKTSTAAGMNSPTSVDSDENRIFVADAGNHRVLIFQGFPTAQFGTAATFLVGQQDFSHNSPNDDSGASTGPQDGVSNVAPTARTLRDPSGAFFATASKVLFVTDKGNNRVLVFPQDQLTNN